jgi:hypothetical protein
MGSIFMYFVSDKLNRYIETKSFDKGLILYFAHNGFGRHVIQWENGLGGSGGYERIFFIFAWR